MRTRSEDGPAPASATPGRATPMEVVKPHGDFFTVGSVRPGRGRLAAQRRVSDYQSPQMIASRHKVALCGGSLVGAGVWSSRSRRALGTVPESTTRLPGEERSRDV